MTVTLNDSPVSYENWLNKLAKARMTAEGTYKVLHVVKPDNLPYGQVVFVDPRLNVKVIKLVELESWPEVQKLLSRFGPLYRTLNLVVSEDGASLMLSDSPSVIVPTAYGWASY
jgi:hypothetical protein